MKRAHVKMIDSKFRNSAQPCFDKMAQIFVKFDIGPNMITAAALLSGIAAGIFTAFGMMIPGLILLWLSGLLDVLDGTVARITGKATKLGAYMDLVFDRIVETAMIIGFYFLSQKNALACILFLTAIIFNFSSFIVCGALFENKGTKSMHYDIGIAERTETFIVFSLVMLIPKLSVSILLIFAGIIFLTGIFRFIRIINQQDKEMKC
jgi:archaetidylinositol phosphate synthase